MILMSLVVVVCVRDLGINDDTSLREKRGLVYFSMKFDTVSRYTVFTCFVYILVYMKRVSRGCLKRLQIKVKYVKCVNTLKKLKKSSLLHLHEGIK